MTDQSGKAGSGSCTKQDSSEESVLSAETDAHYRDLDANLALFLLDHEADIKDIPAEQIPTEPVTEEDKIGLPFRFECAFGWAGDTKEPGERRNGKETLIVKLHEARNGCLFFSRTLEAYRNEINTIKHHEFPEYFLKKQNEAVAITEKQLLQIHDKLGEVLDDVHAVSNDTQPQTRQGELTKAYEHSLPWILRAKRVMYDSHVWYKLNYTISAYEKFEKTVA